MGQQHVGYLELLSLGISTHRSWHGNVNRSLYYTVGVIKQVMLNKLKKYIIQKIYREKTNN